MSDVVQTEAKRGPGRPPKEQAAESSRPQRPARKPYGSVPFKLAYDEREGFHRHWVNDMGGRIEEMTERGYSHVTGKDGKHVSRRVGSHPDGGALTAYLMEIPEGWWTEDQVAKQKIVDEMEETIKRGELNRQQGDGRYVPAQGISIRR